jgi:hypothetical protein
VPKRVTWSFVSVLSVPRISPVDDDPEKSAVVPVSEPA